MLSMGFLWFLSAMPTMSPAYLAPPTHFSENSSFLTVQNEIPSGKLRFSDHQEKTIKAEKWIKRAQKWGARKFECDVMKTIENETARIPEETSLMESLRRSRCAQFRAHAVHSYPDGAMGGGLYDL
ncbi:hypothetical protein NECAME_09108 [Necator americanus]|uniref:Uncharacterized protein n=1 Tax=Necator americanus TaxID=51031 RepID=W2TEP0_NECAM|nr:hypothetical protein NECAME_09108 [Necator americanus]ETN80525.1 hypothetical protein NECAME_09108 [Necator americanus]